MNRRVKCLGCGKRVGAAGPAAAGAMPRSCYPLLLVTAMAFLAVSWWGCGGPAPPPTDKSAKAAPEPKAPPPPKPIDFARPNPITLDPGASAAVDLKIERNGNKGPIKIAARVAPEGITVSPLEIPADKSEGKLKVAAALKLGDETLAANLPLLAKVGQVEAEQTLGLTVKKVNIPSFQPVHDMLLQPGASAGIDLKIERNGFQGPLELRLEGLPQKVSGKVGKIAADQTTTRLELVVAGDAPEATQAVRVLGTLYGRTVAVEVPLKVEREPYVVKSFMEVLLKPGEKKRVSIPVQRRSFKGPLHLEVQNLPPGVTVAKCDLAAAKTEAALEFVAAKDAKERVRSARIVSTGGSLTRSDPIVVRVSHGEQGFLPREITANEQLFYLLRRGSFGGRLTVASKQALLDAYGGTPESEAAVFRGLRWLAIHQQPDGRWSLKHYSEGIDGCDCWTEFEKEVVDNDTAGTAFGLLPFLGAGVTHNRAPKEPAELADYKKVVERGLVYLTRNQVSDRKASNDGFLGGNTYSHAIATMALCEAYGLSGDKRLKVNAQLAIKYLKEAQHKAGGWRYNRKQAGDMSATAWVFLAIRSGQLAGLSIDRTPLVRAGRFLDACSVGPEDAKRSRYAYQPEQKEKLSLSAAGLLTRLYLGWRKDNRDLQAGCKYLMQNLPSQTSDTLGPIYYEYYATQVLHHMEGTDFDLWNHRMREHLIHTQQKTGHRAGSWNPEGSDWGKRGGRLYTTSMALMSLQVYYRHLPMFRPVIRTQGGGLEVGKE